MQDITQRKDLELLVSEFYKKVLADDKIAPVFIGKIQSQFNGKTFGFQ